MPVIEVRFDRYQFSTENSISQLADRRRLNQCPKLQPTKCGVETTRRDLDDQRNFSSADWKSEYRLSSAVRQSSIKVGEERSGRNRWHRSTVLANFRFIFSRHCSALRCAIARRVFGLFLAHLAQPCPEGRFLTVRLGVEQQITGRRYLPTSNIRRPPG